jgi:hypothetical protein
MLQCLTEELAGAYCRHVPVFVAEYCRGQVYAVPVFDSRTSWGLLYICPNIWLRRPHRTTARITSLWEIQTQNLLNANKYITVFLLSTKHQPYNSHYPQLFRGPLSSTQMCTFSAIRTELYYNRGHNWHMALLQHIASKWPKCFMRCEVQAAETFVFLAQHSNTRQFHTIAQYIHEGNFILTLMYACHVGSRRYVWLVTALQLGGYGPPSK